MKKKIIALIVFAITCIGGYFAYTKIIISDKKVVVDMDEEYKEYLQIMYAKEKKESFSDKISEYVEIDFPFIMTRFSKELKCKVTYPDLKSYFIENQEELLKLTEEEFQSKLLEECKNGKKKSITITFPATYDNGFLLLDTDCFEYQDAKSGGLLGFASERYEEILDEMYTEVEE